MKRILRLLFYALIVRPIVYFVIGLNVRRPELLPEQGPAVVCANHNSHLDAMVLVSLFPLRMLPQVRPVAAADYFLRNAFVAWLSVHVLGIIPLDRRARERGEDPLAPSREALERGEILILFPEGSRGEPEQRAEFRKGVAHLVRTVPETRTTPIFLHGLGKALPRGEALLVPFFCDVFVGEAIAWEDDIAAYMQQLDRSVSSLENEKDFAEWE